MANEYLTRTSTSTGNQRTFTWSGWVKKQQDAYEMISFSGANTVSDGLVMFGWNSTAGQTGLYLNFYQSSTSRVYKVDEQYRDFSSWLHYQISVDTTQSNADNRVKFYINGIQRSLSVVSGYSAIPQNYLCDNMTSGKETLIGTGRNSSGNLGGYSKLQLSDIFFVDGQALTPDVFGKYLAGKGYISAGTSVATDFKKGQWVPKSPRVIRSTINARGGFGVNGFYLPMNDSTNFGADFHCEPNSIIKLKGETLAQPTGGAPTTTNNYVDQLRNDPLKDYLTLAVPGISGGLDNGLGDYSAVIKGSGTAAPRTSSNTGLSTFTPSQYGSAIDITGSSDWLNYDIDGNYGFSDFTWECWYYPSADPDTWGLLLKHATNGSWATGISLITKIGTNKAFSIYVGNTAHGAVSYQNNQWYHLALERYNGIITLYVDGVPRAFVAYTNVINNDGVKFSIGSQDRDTSYQSYGYINDLRVYKGVAKYKGGFDVPKHYTPVGISSWRAVPDTTANNFATLNPLTQLDNNNITYTNGNLTGYVAANTNSTTSTIGISSSNSQKYYAEFRATNNAYPRIGVIDATVAQQGISASGSGAASANNLNTSGVISWGGTVNELFINSGTGVVNGGYTTNDIIGVAYDSATRNVWFSKNGVWQNFTGSGANPATGTNPVGAVNGSDSVYFGIRPENANIDANFGQNPTFSGNTSAGTFTDSNGKGLFKYQPPSGFLALCEDNLPTPAIADPGKHFKTVLYTGTGTNRSVAGVGFKPDLVWIKSRNAGSWHVLGDSVRGANRVSFTNNTNQENTSSTTLLGTILSYDNDGFSLAADPDSNANNGWNNAGNSLVAWCWKAGNGTQTNTNGSITSTVSVNQTAGFSIVSWTGNGTSSATVGHGLNKAPSFMISKARSAANDWWVVHKSANGNFRLNSGGGLITDGGSNGAMGFPTTLTNSTFTFTSGSSSVNNVNQNGTTYITYCWTEVEGFSKFGSYVGNSSADGPFIYCGFKPAWIMIKTIDATNGWVIIDNSRKPINPNGETIFAQDVLAEQTDITNRAVDFLSNGFKIRVDVGTERNLSGLTYIFAAFAESPFQTANAK